MHRTTLGDFELTIVSDGTYFLDGGAFFGVVPKTMWSKKGSPVEMRSIEIWRVEDDMFVEHWDELNMLEVFQQIGALPPLGASPDGDA